MSLKKIDVIWQA